MALVERILGRDIGVEAVVEELLLQNPLAAGAAGHQRRVDAVALERLDDLGGLHLRDLQLHLGITLHEGRDEAVEQVGGDGGDDAQTQTARRLALELGHRLADVVVGPERLARPVEHHLARLGGDHGLLRAVEQHHAQLLLQGLDLHAQRGLRHETVFGRLREAAAVGHRQQVFELDDRHVRISFDAKI